MSRVLVNVLIILLFKITPIWVLCLVLIVFAWFFINPIEIIFYGLLIDVWYNSVNSIIPFHFIYFILMILVYIATTIIKKNIRK